LPADLDLSGFVREHIRTVWALEILLLLKKDRDHCWTAGDIERELRASHKLVLDNLARFTAAGLAEADEASCYRYAPATADLAALSDQLERAYLQRPVAVITMIANAAGPLQSLADAFKFRGDGK
jgi:hypothetical protein